MLSFIAGLAVGLLCGFIGGVFGIVCYAVARGWIDEPAPPGILD